jgi:hypothetical protein
MGLGGRARRNPPSGVTGAGLPKAGQPSQRVKAVRAENRLQSIAHLYRKVIHALVDDPARKRLDVGAQLPRHDATPSPDQDVDQVAHAAAPAPSCSSASASRAHRCPTPVSL